MHPPFYFNDLIKCDDTVGTCLTMRGDAEFVRGTQEVNIT